MAIKLRDKRLLPNDVVECETQYALPFMIQVLQTRLWNELENDPPSEVASALMKLVRWSPPSITWHFAEEPPPSKHKPTAIQYVGSFLGCKELLKNRVKSLEDEGKQVEATRGGPRMLTVTVLFDSEEEREEAMTRLNAAKDAVDEYFEKVREHLQGLEATARVTADKAVAARKKQGRPR